VPGVRFVRREPVDAGRAVRRYHRPMAVAEQTAGPALGLGPVLETIDLPVARWDDAGRLLACNAAWARWTGQSRTRLQGRSLGEQLGEAAAESARAALAQARTGQRAGCLLHRDTGPASDRPARLEVYPELDGQGRVTGLCTLVLQHDDDALGEVQGRLERIERMSHSFPYPITYVDRDFSLRFVNRAYLDVTHETAANVLGRHIGEVRGSRRWDEHRPYYDEALAGRTVHYTRLVEIPPLGPRWLRTSYVPNLDADGSVIGVYTVAIDVHDLAVAQEQLRRSVERDALTDVLSRHTMMGRIEAEVARAAQQPVALFFVDLDGFKDVNDRLGHHEGDALLVRVAAALRSSVRASDAVGRFGGDEFLVLAAVHDPDNALTLASHMLAAVREVTGDHAAGPVTASIGYALAPADAQDPIRLLQRADEAMYLAKRFGKDRVLHCAAFS